MKPTSCDTFVVLPPASNSCVVFGKNSDRPEGEVQEVVFFPGQNHNDGTKLKCTYIEIDQADVTLDVILSKPSWMWGAEMGANNHQVCIGNEAVWTHLNGPQDDEEKLLGMDLVRLGLERGKTSKEAMDVITSMLEKYGQGGPCQDSGGDWSYHNSFLIADPREAWVVETAGQLWAAERVTSGIRNISNDLTIRTQIDAKSNNLEKKAAELGLWDAEKYPEFDFAKTFASHFSERELSTDPDCKPSGRQSWGRKLLSDHSRNNNFQPHDMFGILRDERSGICMDGGFVSAGSQVSKLSSTDRPCHWFTAAPNPQKTCFKPFIFCDNVQIGNATTSPVYKKDPAKCVPRFQFHVDRRFDLWKSSTQFWESISDNSVAKKVRSSLKALEEKYYAEMLKKSGSNFDPTTCFKDAVNQELEIYASYV